MANNNHIDESLMLKTGSILRNTYRIEGYLSSGGFGNTYVVTHINLNRKFALKEFFMKDVSERENNQSSVRVSNAGKLQEFSEQREKFKKEARRLCDLNNKHIVRVYDLFDENETSYYVMDFIDGENLKDKLKREGKPMTEAAVLNVLRQLMDALQEVHNLGLWHLDLKPANIMMDKNGVVKLIDFGASKQFDASKGGAISTSAVSYTKGYAPIEQIGMSYDKFGPWTDFYALGATLYNLLSNRTPPMSSDISEDTTPDKSVALPYPEGVSRQMRGLVQWMMRTNRKERPQSVKDIINYLNLHMSAPKGQSTIPPKPKIATSGPSMPQQQSRPAPVRPAMAHGMVSSMPSSSGKPQKPDSNMVWAVLSTVLCCLPIGIFAIINSNRVDELYARGDYQGAEEAAKASKNYVKWSVITASIAWIIAIILTVLGTLSQQSYDDYSYDNYDYLDSTIVEEVLPPDQYYDQDLYGDSVTY